MKLKDEIRLKQYFTQIGEFIVLINEKEKEIAEVKLFDGKKIADLVKKD